jgi:FkbM family methyltransferase
MIVDPTDQVVSKSILDTGSWETSLLTFIAAFVSPTHSVLNIGSQTGMEAVLMGKLVGPGGRLTVFEPYSVSYKILVKNLQINGLSPISRAFKLGAGEKEGTVALWIDETNTGGTTFIREGDSSGMEEVEVRRVDDVMDGDKLDFVLMDTEKTEVAVLSGMREVL